jgi:ribosomal protein S11
MQKQKNLKFKKKFISKYKKIKFNKLNSSNSELSFYRMRKMLKHKPYLTNPTFQKITMKNISKKFYKQINIRITPNNVFCTLKNNLRNKTLYVASTGKCNTKTSKKILKYSSKIITQTFFEKIKEHLNSNKFIVNIIGPQKIKKSILEQVGNNLKGKCLVVNVEPKKCFNGCRPPKKKRKKQKGIRIFK